MNAYILDFRDAGVPHLVIQRITDYLVANGVVVKGLTHDEWAYMATFQIALTPLFDPSSFGSEYDDYMPD